MLSVRRVAAREGGENFMNLIQKGQDGGKIVRDRKMRSIRSDRSD
jgi:hypothetical protein